MRSVGTDSACASPVCEILPPRTTSAQSNARTCGSLGAPRPASRRCAPRVSDARSELIQAGDGGASCTSGRGSGTKSSGCLASGGRRRATGTYGSGGTAGIAAGVGSVEPRHHAGSDGGASSQPGGRPAALSTATGMSTSCGLAPRASQPEGMHAASAHSMQPRWRSHHSVTEHARR